LSYSTNQNNLLLQLKGLSSTEDYANASRGMGSMPPPMAPPPPMASTGSSVLDMIE
ncbi:MAG: hypothetical protein IT174_17295, partial [Acidobacteria bacterium]|nr:hypothetical protein [Acidobacteriota bacterium]